MTRRWFFPMLTAPLWGGSEEALDVLTAIASALSEGNARAFLQAFDREMPGYAAIESNVTALTDQADILCSIDTLKESGDDSSRTVEVDWFIQLRSKSAGGPLERRRQIVTVKLAKRKKKWKIVGFDPAAILAVIARS